MIIKRGEILLADFNPVRGHEQGKIRPCLIIQNDIGNTNSPTTIVASITSKADTLYPFLVKITADESNLPKDSFIQLNQIRTMSINERFIKKIGNLNKEKMREVDTALKISLGLD